MNNQKIKLHDIPEEFNLKIPKKLVNYSVALGRVGEITIRKLSGFSAQAPLCKKQVNMEF